MIEGDNGKTCGGYQKTRANKWMSKQKEGGRGSFELALILRGGVQIPS